MMGKKIMVVGLGNVGSQYQGTRHNIGFDVVDKIAINMQVDFETAKYAHIAEKRYRGKNISLIKPTTYMNLSGKAVKYWSGKYRIAPSEMVVITDDLHLPLGMLRIRTQGSSGGHNGLKDIEQALGTKSYPRIRIGIAPIEQSQSSSIKGFVLNPWGTYEMAQKETGLEQAERAIYYMLKHGIEKAMNVYNSKVKRNGNV